MTVTGVYVIIDYRRQLRLESKKLDVYSIFRSKLIFHNDFAYSRIGNVINFVEVGIVLGFNESVACSWCFYDERDVQSLAHTHYSSHQKFNYHTRTGDEVRVLIYYRYVRGQQEWQ